MEESAVALVPSSQRVVLSAPFRHSFPNLPNDLTLVLNNAHQTPGPPTSNSTTSRSRESKPQYTWEALSIIISALYCKILVVLGLALPVTQTITTLISVEFFDRFYVYLYGGSLLFMLSVNIITLKKKTLRKISRHVASENEEKEKNDHEKFTSHGSFYLRLGACGFGVGSMVYSGLEFGNHFLLKDETCYRTVLSASKPALRMLFTLFQIQFIFLNDNSIHKAKYPSLMRICLGHMLATNLAEWLAVIIEEAKHEIHHLRLIGHSSDHHGQSNYTNSSQCDDTNSDSLIRGVTAYLFPCTIEYSLICGVTLMELLKDIQIDKKKEKEEKAVHMTPIKRETRLQYSVDCTHSEKGLTAGLVANVYTLISLIVFFSLRTSQQETAYFCLTLCESILNAASLIAIAIAAVQMRNLAYCVHRFDSNGSLCLGLDISLLMKAQNATYLYSIFSAIACYFTPGAAVWPDLFTILQTSIQTSFIVDTWWKRCATPRDQEKKPGRQCLTFLRSVNVAMWIITITEKNRAEYKPVQLQFYGIWPWTIITHVSMPLYVFYRFHSSICFFEVWRNSYKGIHVTPDTDLVF